MGLARPMYQGHHRHLCRSVCSRRSATMKLKHGSVAAVTLAALLGGLAAPAGAGTNINGKIAYEVCDYSSGPYQCDIWTMESDGSNAVNITNTPEVSEYAPVWSPDGLRIA